MTMVYRVLAYVIAAAVLVQAAAVAYGFFGLGTWIEKGGTLDKAAMESDTTTFTGLGGLVLHGQLGTMIIPIIALLFLITGIVVQLTARLRGAFLWSLATLVAVVVQVTLGLAAHSIPLLGILHGIFAFVLLGTAAFAGRRIGTAASAGATRSSDSERRVPA